MYLFLRELDDFPAEVDVNVGKGEVEPFYDGVLSVDWITVHLEIQHASQEYFCQGQVSAGVKLECVRCLAEFDDELSGPTDFVICESEIEVIDGRVIDDEEYLYCEGNDLRVNIWEPVRQALVLAMSLKPVCSEDCKGLCASCGTNLNLQTCTCRTEEMDPRWEGLKKLLPSDEDSSQKE
ncbi:MAG: DUF177 domain-containing protein [candidate division Zixibacteria bacterium]|nr:DUF177 domain-containing protein [candidate division Zixibacteria bacterium]